MTRMVNLINQGRPDEALKIQNSLKPLLDLVVVTTEEETKFGPVACRARNPLPLKTIMQLLGMPSGPCRKPLGKMTTNGFKRVLETMQQVHRETPDIFTPIADFFQVNIDDRLNNTEYQKTLCYDY